MSSLFWSRDEIYFQPKIFKNPGIMRKYKIQLKVCDTRRYFLEESLDLLFPSFAQPYMVAESSTTTKKKCN